MSSDTRRHALRSGVAILWALPLTAAAGPGCDDQPVRLTAVWYDVVEHFHDAGAGAAEELRRHFCQMGVNTNWRRARPGDVYGQGPGLEVPIVILGSHPFQSRGSRPIMGEVPELWTSPEPRPIRVYVDGIRKVLALGRSGAGTELLMQRAVGRVATHEMVHSLAPSQGHADDGLMSSRLDRKALVGRAPAMAPGHVSAVRAALRIDTRQPAVSIADKARIAPLYGTETPLTGGSPPGA
jgi:hypothetical protein